MIPIRLISYLFSIINEEPTRSANGLMRLAYVIWKKIKNKRTSTFQFETFYTSTEEDRSNIPPELGEPGPCRPPTPLRRRGSKYPFPPLPPPKPRRYDDNELPYFPPGVEEAGPSRPPSPLRRSGSKYPFPSLPPPEPRGYDDNEPNDDHSENLNSFENLFRVKVVDTFVFRRERFTMQSSNPDRRTNRWPKNHNKRLQKAYKGAKKGKRKDH